MIPVNILRANNFDDEERTRNEGKMYSWVSNLRLRLLERSVDGEVVGRRGDGVAEVEQEVATGGSRLYYGNYMINTTRP